MSSYRRIVFALVLAPLLLMTSHLSWAQGTLAANQHLDSDQEMFRQVEENVRTLSTKQFVRDRQLVALRAERQLGKILQLYPDTHLREQVEESLSQVQEILAEHHLTIAVFYMNRPANPSTKGAESRLRMITCDFPKFSRMDEVLFLLGKVSLMDERTEDAADYFKKLTCRYPGSRYAGESFKQLFLLGVNTSEDCN